MNKKLGGGLEKHLTFLLYDKKYFFTKKFKIIIIDIAKMIKETNFNNQIYLNDCLSAIEQLPDECADIVLVDPPYNIKKDFGNNKDNLSLDDYITGSKAYLTECYRVLKPTGTMYVYGFSEILAHLSVLFPIKKQRGLEWFYTNKTVPSLNFGQRAHESILCLGKDKPIFNRDSVRVPYAQQFLKNAAGKIRPSTKNRFNQQGRTTVYIANENGALPKDVLTISTLAGGKGAVERYFYCKTCKQLCHPKTKKEHLGHNIVLHPTQKPMALTTKLLLAAKPEANCNVLIPFAGSGSECVVCQKLGLNFLAYDINPDYVLLGQEGLKATKEED